MQRLFRLLQASHGRSFRVQFAGCSATLVAEAPSLWAPVLELVAIGFNRPAINTRNRPTSKAINIRCYRGERSGSSQKFDHGALGDKRFT
jgi:hypothetical protein